MQPELIHNPGFGADFLRVRAKVPGDPNTRTALVNLAHVATITAGQGPPSVAPACITMADGSYLTSVGATFAEIAALVAAGPSS